MSPVTRPGTGELGRIPQTQGALSRIQTTALQRRPGTGSGLAKGGTPTTRMNKGMIIVWSEIPNLTKAGVLSSGFVFQCAPSPDEFPVAYSWQWTDFGTLDGMDSNPNYALLTTITWSTLVVDEMLAPEPVGNPGQAPLPTIKRIKEIGDSMTPFQMQAGTPGMWKEWEPLGRDGSAAIAVTLRNFNVTERAGEPDARYLTITVTEFGNPPSMRDVQLPKAGASVASVLRRHG
jgi:hypothetical protein